MNEFQGLNHSRFFFRKRSYDRAKSEFNANWSLQYNFRLQTFMSFVSLW